MNSYEVLDISYKLMIACAFMWMCTPERSTSYFIAVMAFAWAILNSPFELMERGKPAKHFCGIAEKSKKEEK